MVKFTQKNFDTFCDALNHRMTRIEGNVGNLETSVCWVKWIMGYMAVLLTSTLFQTIIF